MFENIVYSAVDKPEMLQIRRFQKSDGKSIDIASHVVDSTTFSACILEDANGVMLAGIQTSIGHNPEAVNNEIFVKWLLGKGLRPVQWQTLLHCLEVSNFNELVMAILAEMDDKVGMLCSLRIIWTCL